MAFDPYSELRKRRPCVPDYEATRPTDGCQRTRIDRARHVLVIVGRLSPAIYQDLSGAGGLRFKGRWNEMGLPIVYTSVLERRVHSLEQPRDDVAIEIEVPDDRVEPLAPLPTEWKDIWLSPEGLELLGWSRTGVFACRWAGHVPNRTVQASNLLRNSNPSHSESHKHRMPGR